ncbi:unnamed protein product [Onchocerca ochengi]|uniref:EF-hand domain-containing protein n=1 Tax=Onchocerca ochengi TaxID=42157 RepID=A0A182E422_ONCOC|nr:unnamed protein product [Onchocerca ochengi]
MTDGTIAISYKERHAPYTSTSKLKELRPHQDVMQVTADDGNNNDSFVMNLSRLSEKIGDKSYIRGITTTQENSATALLPPVSPLHFPMQISKHDLTDVVSSTIPLQLSALTARKNRHSQGSSFDEPEMSAANNEIGMENNEHLNVLPSVTFTTSKNPGKDIIYNDQHQLIMDHISKVFENTVSPDVSNDKNEAANISPLHLNPDIFTKLLEAPRKFKWFENFEQEQENVWNCSRQVPSSPSCLNYDKNPYVVSPDGNTHEKVLGRKKKEALQLMGLQIWDDDVLQDNQELMNSASEDPSNDVILDDPNDSDISWLIPSYVSVQLKFSRQIQNPNYDKCSHFISQIVNTYDKTESSKASTPERIEDERNESFFEAFLPSDLNSSTLHEADTLDETDSSSSNIPRFHYPYGIPINGKESCNNLDAVKKLFHKYNNQVNLSHMKKICSASGLCPLWKRPLYNCILTSVSNFITFNEFASWWKKFDENARDEASRFVYILTNGNRNFLTANDFEALIQDLIETVPSLYFLNEAVAFHQAYIKTAITMLERADINEEREFFSYEHFYVIYYNFHYLDKCEKHYLTPIDLSFYSNGALTNLVVQRIFSGAVSLNSSMKQTMDYTAFVNFLLAEIDKCHPKSIEYWFRIMDLNGDGRISFDEMKQFYNEIVVNVIRMDMDVITFSDLINKLNDMISPHSSTYFTLSDFKRFPSLARYFFNTFVNWIKHIAQENSFPDKRNEIDRPFNDWNRFCKLEYEIFVANLLDDD